MPIQVKKIDSAISNNYEVFMDSEDDENSNNRGRENSGSDDITQKNILIVKNVDEKDKTSLRDPHQIIDKSNWAFTQSESLTTFFNYISPIDWALAKPFISFRAYGPYVISYDKLSFDIWSDKRLNEAGTASRFGVTKYANDGFSEALGSEAYFAPITLSNTNKAFHNRGSYQQKFKPLFAISGLDVDIIQAPGSITFTDNIKLKLTIFDRTKLRELTSLFNPMFGTHFVIEYGWQHPHANSEFIKEDFPFDMYGLRANFDGELDKSSSKWKTIPEFINSLRHRGVYILENFDISLGEGMTATANFSLVSVLGNFSSSGIGILNLSFKEELAHLSETLRGLKKEVKDGRSGNSSSLVGKKGKEKQLKDKISILQGKDISSLSKSEQKKFNKTIQVVQSSKTSIQQRINSFFNHKKNEKLLENCFRKINDGAQYSPVIYVPKIVSKKQKGINTVDITEGKNGEKYSYLLGVLEGFFKNLSRDIKSSDTSGVPLLYSNLVKGMYIRYYPFNKYCGLMSGKSIGSFILDKEEIINKVFETISSNPDYNISLEKFFGIIESIIANKMNPNYGMVKFFDYAKNRPKEDDKIEEAYNTFIKESSNGQFVLPKIRFRIIAAPDESKD